MRVLLTSEARFERTPDGVVWGPAAYGRTLWCRYLDVFSSVLIAARVVDVPEPSAGCVRASRTQVEFCSLPPYAGMSGLIGNLLRVRGRLASAVHRTPAIIVRTPSPLAYLVYRVAVGNGRPFAAEIVGDPDQVFSPGAFRHPLRVPIRGLAAAWQRQIARDAAVALYVTREALQHRYPSRGRRYAASDAALDDSAFGGGHAQAWMAPAPFVLVAVGGLDQPYKGTSVLLHALHRLRRAGAPVTLRIVGGGRLLPGLRRDCEALGLSPAVEFLGQQDSAGVRDALDSAHLFVLPSLTEGLPRALLEAMARGLPAVASDVGGMRELLPSDCLAPPRDPDALAARIEQLMSHADSRRRLGDRNREIARSHHESQQAPVRRAFLRQVRRASSARAISEARCA